MKMAELRTFLEELGFSDVATYVQSGNAVFGARAKDAVALTKSVEDAFEKRWGFRSRIMVRDGKWFARLVDGNPYPEAADDPTKLHAFVCEQHPAEAGGLPRATRSATAGSSKATCSTSTRRTASANRNSSSKFPARSRCQAPRATGAQCWRSGRCSRGRGGGFGGAGARGQANGQGGAG